MRARQLGFTHAAPSRDGTHVGYTPGVCDWCGMATAGVQAGRFRFAGPLPAGLTVAPQPVVEAYPDGGCTDCATLFL